VHYGGGAEIAKILLPAESARGILSAVSRN